MLFSIAEAFEESGGSRMYTVEPPILYSEEALRRAKLRSASKIEKNSKLLCSEEHDAVRSLLRWLFLHRRLRSRQRGSCPEGLERHHTHLADHFQGALSVFIRTTRISPRANPREAFRLRLRRFRTAAFRSFCPRTVCHHNRSTSRCRSKCP